MSSITEKYAKVIPIISNCKYSGQEAKRPTLCIDYSFTSKTKLNVNLLAAPGQTEKEMYSMPAKWRVDHCFVLSVPLMCSSSPDPTKIYSQTQYNLSQDNFLQAASAEMKLAAIYSLPQRTALSLH